MSRLATNAPLQRCELANSAVREFRAAEELPLFDYFIGAGEQHGAYWCAELRIPASALGGWDHLVRLNVFHEWARFVGDQNRWPYASAYNGPSTWAITLLGDFKQIYLPVVLR